MTPDDMGRKDGSQNTGNSETLAELTKELEELLKGWEIKNSADMAGIETELQKPCRTPCRKPRPKSRKQIFKARRRGIYFAAFWLFFIYITFHFILGITVLSGNSMRPAFHHGDILLYLRLGAGQIKRGDVLIIRNGGLDGQTVAKRVIAVGGDTVSVDAYGYVTLNGEPLKEPEVLHGYQPEDGWMEFPVTVEEGMFFYLGDNRPVSLDSRNAELGFGTIEQIQGKVLAVFRPEPFPVR